MKRQCCKPSLKFDQDFGLTGVEDRSWLKRPFSMRILRMLHSYAVNIGRQALVNPRRRFTIQMQFVRYKRNGKLFRKRQLRIIREYEATSRLGFREPLQLRWQ
jgi:hypothetical protein